MRLLGALLLAALAVVSADRAEPTFNWGDPSSCAPGSGSFSKPLNLNEVATVGVIPIGKNGVKINLDSPQDADIQLSEAGGAKARIVAYPSGRLNGSTEACTSWGPMRICYSGYNGITQADGKQYKSTMGQEWLRIEGTTDRELVVQAFGYAPASIATLKYSYDAPAVCCSGSGGSGSFTQSVPKSASALVGTIPRNVRNVKVALTSPNDIDLRLTDLETGKVLVGYPDGVLNGPSENRTVSDGVVISYSGYNGKGYVGTEGDEWIRVDGTLSHQMKLEVVGYVAGTASVVYSSDLPDVCTAGAGGGGSGADGNLIAADRSISLDLSKSHAVGDAADAALWDVDFNQAGRLAVRRGGRFAVLLQGQSLVDRIATAKFALGPTKYGAPGGGATADAPGWTASVPEYVNADRKGVYVMFDVPASAAVGLYPVTVTVPGFAPANYVIGHVAVLFNPWNPACPEYVADAASRAEYVSRGDGRLWYGSVNEKGTFLGSSMAWNYHQYALLGQVLRVLGREYGAPNFDATQSWWNDPARVSREITYLIPKRVLVGNWAGNYESPPGSKPPTAWTNSWDIFENALKQGAPTRYGQCWVFSAVTTTTLRALGIAARPVTNFQSAHDASHPVDLVIEAGAGSDDSIWNFHVWTEGWIARGAPAVPQWNAIDSTPQEMSDGRYQDGPAGMEAVRRRQVTGDWDVGFTVASVGSVSWANDHVRGPFTPGKLKQFGCVRSEGCDDRVVGQYISTLRPACVGEANTCRQDVTAEYKPGWAPWGEGTASLVETGARAAQVPSGPAATTANGTAAPAPAPAPVATTTTTTTTTAAAATTPADVPPPFLPMLRTNESGPLSSSMTPEMPLVGDSLTFRVTVSPVTAGRLVLSARMIYEDGTAAHLPPGECGCCQNPAPPPACSCGPVETHPSFCAPAAPTVTHCCCGADAPAPYHIRPSGGAFLAVQEEAMLLRQVLLANSSTSSSSPLGAAGESSTATTPEPGVRIEGERLARLEVNLTNSSDPAASRAFDLVVPAEEYAKYLWKSSTVRLEAHMVAPDGEYMGRTRFTTTFLPARVTVQQSCRQIRAGQPFVLRLGFTNRLPLPLSNLQITLDGPGNTTDQVLSYPGRSIAPQSTAVMESKPMVIGVPGPWTIAVSLESCQYHDAFGDVTLEVAPELQRFSDPDTICNDMPVSAKGTSA